jgi:hypothetical protein
MDQVNANIARLVIAGLDIGSTMKKSVPHSPHPSTLAAYSTSLGSVIKNCLIRKIPNPVIDIGRKIPVYVF